MVFIVEDVAVAASLVGAAAVKTAKPSPKPNRSNNDENARAPLPSPAAAASALGRRLDVALAVSQAFDATLLHLARELRRGTGTSTGRGQGVWGSKGRSGGRHEGSSTSASSFHRRRPDAMAQSQLQSAAIVRAAGAGLYLDAYETAVACLLRAFNCLAEGGPERQEKLGSSPPPFSDEPHGPDQHQTLVETRRGGRRSSDENARFGVQERGEASDASNRPTTSKGPVEKGFVPRGWDAEVRRNVWAQRKLEVLGMSFLRIERENRCPRFCGWRIVLPPAFMVLHYTSDERLSCWLSVLYYVHPNYRLQVPEHEKNTMCWKESMTDRSSLQPHDALHEACLVRA